MIVLSPASSIDGCIKANNDSSRLCCSWPVAPVHQKNSPHSCPVTQVNQIVLSPVSLYPVSYQCSPLSCCYPPVHQMVVLSGVHGIVPVQPPVLLLSSSTSDGRTFRCTGYRTSAAPCPATLQYIRWLYFQVYRVSYQCSPLSCYPPVHQMVVLSGVHGIVPVQPPVLLLPSSTSDGRTFRCTGYRTSAAPCPAAILQYIRWSYFQVYMVSYQCSPLSCCYPPLHQMVVLSGVHGIVPVQPPVQA